MALTIFIYFTKFNHFLNLFLTIGNWSWWLHDPTKCWRSSGGSVSVSTTSEVCRKLHNHSAFWDEWCPDVSAPKGFCLEGTAEVGDWARVHDHLVSTFWAGHSLVHCRSPLRKKSLRGPAKRTVRSVVVIFVLYKYVSLSKVLTQIVTIEEHRKLNIVVLYVETVSVMNINQYYYWNNCWWYKVLKWN